MSGSKLLATVYLDGGAKIHAGASTLNSGEVVASVTVRAPGTFEHILDIYSSNLDALDDLGNALLLAANLGRAEAAKAAAPDSSPEAAGVPPTAAPGEPSAEAVAR